MSRVKIFSMIIFSCLANINHSNATDMGIVTGGPSGTYIEFGRDISKYVSNFDIELDVRTSAGSLENVNRIRREAGVQLGIVQADVLYFILEQENDPDLRDYVKNLRMVFPLYNEEIHILASPGLRDFSDLTGKKVAVGAPDSGSALTASFLFQLSGVNPSERVELGGTDALDALKRGDVDAMFYVVGQPGPLFRDNVTENDKLQLLSINNESILQSYPKAIIEAQSYPWLKDDIESIAVRAVLMSFDYRGDNCKNVGKVAKIVSDNIECLKQHGHPKWKIVDLNSNPPRWTKYTCVDDSLNSAVSYRLDSCELGNTNSPRRNCDDIENPITRALCRMKNDTAPNQ